MPSRPLPKTAKAVGLFLIIVALAVLLFKRPASTDDSAKVNVLPDGKSPEALAATLSSSGLPQDAQPHPAVEEQLPKPTCWEGLLAFDQAASLATFRSALKAAIGSNDRFLANYLKERLTELIGNDSARANEVLNWAEKSSQPETGIYLGALKDSEAVHHPKVAERLLKMGENGKGDLDTRNAALEALETQRSLSPAAIQTLKGVALDEKADSSAWVATRTLGRIMKEDFERTGTYAPYLDQLLDIGHSSDDAAVRILALEMPSYSEPLIGGAAVTKLGEVLRTDGERDVREMAALRLSVTKEPDKALESYRAAFEAERDLCVRWAIFRFTVRVAGAAALPTLQEFAQKDSRLLQDYVEFKELYDSGIVDFSRIWLGKKEHHECLVEEGTPHG
jgi:hypothetical protein